MGSSVSLSIKLFYKFVSFFSSPLLNCDLVFSVTFENGVSNFLITPWLAVGDENIVAHSVEILTPLPKYNNQLLSTSDGETVGKIF